MTAADPALSLSDDELTSVFHPYSDVPVMALALSGGPDSMALAYALSRWAGAQAAPPRIHALTVDHGLRAESATEAQRIAGWVKGWPEIIYHILPWEGDKPDARIMEEARRARYALMYDYCEKNGINHLFIAHHQDDQAETFLIRLAAGSGLDGLAGMRHEQKTDKGISLIRPLLSFPKERLIATCQAHDVPFVEDPSNQKQDYLRPRLRAARDVLEEEGLSNKRLAVTASRLARARSALEYITHQAFDTILQAQADNALTLDFKGFSAYPEEIRVRLVLRAIALFSPGKDYAPRMEKVEDLVLALGLPDFSGRTLGGCIFAIRQGGQALWVSKE